MTFGSSFCKNSLYLHTFMYVQARLVVPEPLVVFVLFCFVFVFVFLFGILEQPVASSKVVLKR